MTSLDVDITSMLNRTTQIYRHVNGDLQWRVIVDHGARGKQVERLAVGLTDARRLRDVLRANGAAAKPGHPPPHAARLAKPDQRQADSELGDREIRIE